MKLIQGNYRMTDIGLRDKALLILERLRRSKGAPCKKWRSAPYFGVPAEVMQQLAAEGLCETRKVSDSSPQEFR